MLMRERSCCRYSVSCKFEGSQGCVSGVPAGFLVQADDQSHYQSHDADYDDQSNQAYSLPASSSRNICIVPQILKLLPFRPRNIPQSVLRRPMSIDIPRRLSKKPSAERAIVCLRRYRQRRIGVLSYDRQSVIERAGPGASSTSSTIGGMARQGAVTKVGRPNKVH